MKKVMKLSLVFAVLLTGMSTYAIDGNEALNLHVLKGISLDLHKGENIAVLGKSGTGKSVLIKIIFFYFNPNSLLG